MPLPLPRRALIGLLLAALPGAAAAQQGGDPLPSWRDGASKRAILDFLEATTREGGPDFVAPAERVAVFDNDGTLWVEQPVYAELVFAFDRIRALAPQHPEWAEREPFRSVLAGDMAQLARSGMEGLSQIVAVTHTGMTPDAFRQTALDWLATARHPRFQRPYTECVYRPMLEVLALFRARGFRTCIVSGGTTEFMRPWAARTYGVPPEQVIGTAFRLRYQPLQGRGELLTLPEIELVDDGPGKPAGISRSLGRRPTAAFGHSVLPSSSEPCPSPPRRERPAGRAYNARPIAAPSAVAAIKARAAFASPIACTSSPIAESGPRRLSSGARGLA